jgi:ribosomal protein S18 acetylase RimI-like enzyme
MDLSIRPARSEDYETLCQLLEQGDTLHREHHPEIFQKPPGPVRDPFYIESVLSDTHHLILLAEYGERLVGSIHVSLRESSPVPILTPRVYAVIENVIVDEVFRQKGIGQMLMREAEAWAQENGASMVELNVYDFNQAAIALYERLGYHMVSHKMARNLDNLD